MQAAARCHLGRIYRRHSTGLGAQAPRFSVLRGAAATGCLSRAADRIFSRVSHLASLTISRENTSQSWGRENIDNFETKTIDASL